MTPLAEVALLTTLSGGALLGAAAAGDPAGGIAPYVGGGAGAIAVAGLLEVTRRLLNGRLIPRETKDFEEELSAAIVAAGQREAQAMQAVEQSRRAVEDIRDEMRELRRMMERST